MKNLLSAVLAGTILNTCGPTTDPEETARCLDRNLDDVTDIVDAADNAECHFRYDTEGFEVFCPSMEIRTVRSHAYDVLFYDENNYFNFSPESMFLNCGRHDYEIDDKSELESIEGELQRRFSFLPIPD